MLIFGVCLLIFIAIVALASFASKDSEAFETDSESYSINNEPCYNNTSSIQETVKSDDLRVNGDASISLPAITSENRSLLRSAVKPWNTAHDTQTGVVVKVVGGNYRTQAAREVYATLKVGDKVTLKVDPDNEYDDTAVKVYAKRCHIGYVPEKFSSVIYSYLILENFDNCYVIEPSKSGSYNNLQIVLFLK